MKAIFFLLHLALVGLAAFQGYMIFYPHPTEPGIAEVEKEHPQSHKGAPPPATRRDKDPDRQMQIAVIKRNLFKVMVDLPTADKSQSTETTKPKPEKTKLKLALWGTVAGVDPSKNWAVIEDLKTRKQDLYMSGDRVLGAEIKEILRNQVILTLDEKDQVIEAQTKFSPDRPGKKTAMPAFSNSALDNLPIQSKDKGNLFKNLKSRPYMKDGSPSGVLIYGIRPGSPMLTMGLKNGDIIQTINETDIKTSNDLKDIVQTLASDLEINILLSRRGQEKEIVYKGVHE